MDRLEAPIADFFAAVTKDEFLEGAIKRQMLGYPVATIADIDRNPQLQARSFWQHVEDGGSGKTLKYPGGFAIMAALQEFREKHDVALQPRWSPAQIVPTDERFFTSS